MSANTHLLNSTYLTGESTATVSETETKALEFFWRAELSDTLQAIWESAKRLPLSSVLKLVKAVAIITAVILLSQGLSLSGILALAASLAGLLFAAISNALVWLIYIPLYFVKTPEFIFSIILAVGLAWLTGVSPFMALTFSPLIILGFRRLERSEAAQMPASDVFDSIGQPLQTADIPAAIHQAKKHVAKFIGNIFPQRLN